MRYRIRFHPEADRDFRRLPGFVSQRFRRLAESLAADPAPPESDELRDSPAYRRIWVDRYRLVYRVQDDTGTVWILRAGLKEGPEFYDDLPEV